MLKSSQSQPTPSANQIGTDSDGDQDGDTAATDAAKAPGTGDIVDIKA